MKKNALLACVLSGLAACWCATAKAQEVYWTSSGMFGPYNIQVSIPGYPDARDILVTVSMFIIKHPKGVVVFDTGNNVAISDGKCKDYWLARSCDFLKPTQKPADVIDRHLEKIGLYVDDVKVVVTSHSHMDHVGNIAMFSKAVHVFQKKELYQGCWPEKFQGRETPGTFVLSDLSAARNYNFYEIKGDYDLFGDSSVIIISTPGHTLGHQSLNVKLATGNTVIMTQDALAMQENADGYVVRLNYSVKDWTASASKLKFMRDLEGARLLFSQDHKQFEAGGNQWLK